MSARSHKWAREQIQAHPEWSTVTRFLLRELADFHRGDHETVWPSRRVLAEMMDVTERTVTRHLRLLESEGLIETTSEFRDNGSQTSNRYSLRLTPPVTSDTPPLSPATPLEVSIRSSSGVLRTPSRRRAAPKVPGKASQQRAARKAEEAIDPSNDPRLVEGEDGFEPMNANELAEKFRRGTANDPTLVWNPGGSMKALVGTLYSWMETGLSASTIERMIDAYVAYPGKNPRALPWKEFVSQRALWHAEVTRFDQQDEVEAHRYGSREYWLGSDSVPPTNTTKAGDDD